MTIHKQLLDYVSQHSQTQGIPFDYNAYIDMGYAEIPSLSAETRSTGDLVFATCWNTTENGLQRLIYANLSGQYCHAAEIRFTSKTQTRLHMHKHIELAFVVRGRLVQKIRDKTEVFAQGEICLVDRNALHTDVLLWEDATVLFVGIDNAFFEKALQDDTGAASTQQIKKLINRKKTEYSFVRFVPKENNEQAEHTFECIFDELLHTRPCKTRIVKAYVARLTQLLSTEYRIVLTRDKRQELGTALFQDMMDTIEQQYATVSVQFLANSMKYNPDYLSRLCFKKAGLSLSQYIQKIRMEKALELLETTELSVEKIAQQVGYNNLGFFYKKFKEQYHVTPSKIRKA